MNDKDRAWLKAALAAKGARKKINTRASSSPAAKPAKSTSSVRSTPAFRRAMAAAKEMHACPVCGSCRCEKASNPTATCDQD